MWMFFRDDIRVVDEQESPLVRLKGKQEMLKSGVVPSRRRDIISLLCAIERIIGHPCSRDLLAFQCDEGWPCTGFPISPLPYLNDNQISLLFAPFSPFTQKRPGLKSTTRLSIRGWIDIDACRNHGTTT